MKKTNKIILPRYTMNMSAEKYDRLYMEDIQAHQRRLKHEYPDLRRRLIKAVKFPFRYMVKQMHGKEEYRAYGTINRKDEIFTTGIDITSVVFFKNSRGTCAYVDLDPYRLTDKRGIYNMTGARTSHRYLFTPHFFDRYEMRHGWDDGFSDIHDQFFINNISKGDDYCFYTQITAARPDDYKTLDVWVLCKDGLMLGEIMNEVDFLEGKDYILKINTFLDFDTLTKRQDKYANLLEDIKIVYDEIPHVESLDTILKRTFIVS